MMFSAKRAEAQYSSPVRVMNTTSAPAINSSMDDPGRIPYYSTMSIPTGLSQVSMNYGAVPANHRVVITGMSGYISVASADLFQIALSTSTGSPFGPNFFPPLAQPYSTGASGFYTYFTGAVAPYYLDAGQSPKVTVTDFAGNSITGGGTVALSGYMLDCLAAPCAAIAH